MWDLIYSAASTLRNMVGLPFTSFESSNSIFVGEDVNDFSVMKDHVVEMINLVNEHLSEIHPDANIFLEARVGLSIYTRAYTDQYNTSPKRYYPAMGFNEIMQACNVKVEGTDDGGIFAMVCLLGQMALTKKEIGFDGKIIDVLDENNRIRWVSVNGKMATYVLNPEDKRASLYEIKRGIVKRNSEKNLSKPKPVVDANVSNSKSALFTHATSLNNVFNNDIAPNDGLLQVKTDKATFRRRSVG